MFSGIDRMTVPQQIQNAIRSLFRQPLFRVEANGNQSKWYPQETGIRQGCPLSPYLFLIVMTVMFEDIHHDDQHGLAKHRLAGMAFDEVLYADDTICVSADTKKRLNFWQT